MALETGEGLWICWILFAGYGRRIADELQKRCPNGGHKSETELAPVADKPAEERQIGRNGF